MIEKNIKEVLYKSTTSSYLNFNDNINIYLYTILLKE